MGAPGTTTGPWVADLHNTRRNGGRFYAAIWKPGDAVPIGAITLNVEGMPDTEGRANALQAAASPDLYDALAGLMPKNLGTLPATMPDSATLPLDVTFGELRAARAALAKARGEA